jgi:hypothetical protein
MAGTAQRDGDARRDLHRHVFLEGVGGRIETAESVGNLRTPDRLSTGGYRRIPPGAIIASPAVNLRRTRVLSPLLPIQVRASGGRLSLRYRFIFTA